MKKSSWLMIIVVAGALVAMTATNLSLKKVYDGIDKSNPFWDYHILKSGTFSHVRVLDSKSTRVIFRQAAHGSVGILNGLADQRRVDARIERDTLFVKINDIGDNARMRDWLARTQLVCISSPTLRSISGESAGIMVKDLSEKNLSISLKGKSAVEVETLEAHFDSLSVVLRDSSELKFEMAEEVPSSGVITSRYLKADLNGQSFLDAGHLQVGELEKSLNDTSAIALSGATLGRIMSAGPAAGR